MRYFRLLVAGNAISAYGSYLNMVALNVFVYDVTHSALAAGVFMAVRLVSGVASGFVSGRLVSSFDRKRLMVGADVCQGTALVVLLLAPHGARVALLYGLALVTGCCSTLSQVALRSSVPEIVGAEHRTRANGLLVTGRSLAMIAGFASAGVVVAQLGYGFAFTLDALTFAVSATALLLLPIRTRAAAPRSVGEERTEGGAKSAGGRTRLLVRQVGPVILAMIAVRAVDGLGSSSHNVALPVYSSMLNPAHPATFVSQFWATWAIGNLVTQQVLAVLTRRCGRTPGERAFALGACVMSACFILVFCSLPTLAAIAVALIAGGADGFTEVVYVSRLQAAPDEQRGRLFGLSASAENGGFGLGMLVSGALMESFTPLTVVAWLHGVAIVLCLALLVWLVVRGRGPVPQELAADGSERLPRTATPEGSGR
ncbi:MFS transporter [Streptomyces griseofuscus]|uniref:MFS transporter n=1 Tax=Streptomyces griseofuscus TaxID=146922 RepID=UPI0037F758A7